MTEIIKPSILNRKILKDVDEAVGYDSEGNIISNVYFPALGKVKEYTIYVNEEYSYMYNVRLMDKNARRNGVSDRFVKG